MRILHIITCAKNVRGLISILLLSFLFLPLKSEGHGAVPNTWPTVTQSALDTNNVDVTIIQYLLRSRGFAVKVDGRFGADTRWQVRRFQHSQKLRATGAVDAVTWKRLIVVLRSGSHGDAVKAAQASLQQYIANQSIDGQFGRQTEQAVRLFQKNKGLRVNGVINLATWLRLTDSVAD